MSLNYFSLVSYLQCLGLDEKIIDEMIKLFDINDYYKYSHFASDDEVCNKIGFVLSGMFYMSTENSDGSLLVKDFYFAKKFMLASFNPKEKSTVNVIAIKNSKVLEAKYSDIQSIFEKYPLVEQLSKKRIERELESVYKKLNSFVSTPAKQRYLIFREKFSMFEREIPQYLIAAYLGITPTHLSRIKISLE